MQIPLQREAGRDAGPVYRQIAGFLRREIEAGRIAAGTRLPPIRDLARTLEVNRDTVAMAYEELTRDGLLEATVGRGTFVRSGAATGGAATGGAATPASAALALSPIVERLLELERGLPPFAASDGVVPLHSLVPDPSLYPVEEFRRALGRVLAKEGAELLRYGGPQGHAGLREVLAERLRSGGIETDAGGIALCQGATEGIALAMRLFAQAGDAVAVEEPTYHNVLSTLIALGLRPAPVPMREDGPDLAVLERTLERSDVKLLYTIPTFHNPLGTTTGTAQRRALLGIAARAGKPVVEDAYEMDLRFAGRPVPSLASLDPAGIVVHLFSFSKSLFPGGRVGSIVARGRAADGLLALKRASDLGGALALQAALADFVRSGAYDRHLGRLRRRLRARRDALLEALAREMPGEGVRWTEPEGGYQVWLELPEGIDTRELLADAVRAGVLFAPGAQFNHDGRASRGLRLTIAVADEAAIRRGVAALGQVVKRRLREGSLFARAAGVNL